MQIKLYNLVYDWLKEQYPKYDIAMNFSPYFNDGRIIGLGKVLTINGVYFGRITDVEFIPWRDRSDVGVLNAADPEFFDKFKIWIDSEIAASLAVVRDI